MDKTRLGGGVGDLEREEYLIFQRIPVSRVSTRDGGRQSRESRGEHKRTMYRVGVADKRLNSCVSNPMENLLVGTTT